MRQSDCSCNPRCKTEHLLNGDHRRATGRVVENDESDLQWKVNHRQQGYVECLLFSMQCNVPNKV